VSGTPDTLLVLLCFLKIVHLPLGFDEGKGIWVNVSAFSLD
jgi:hypothetical protein